VRPATPAPTATSAPSAAPTGKRYAIIAHSIAINDTPASARAEADRRLAVLKTKGFRSARVERVEIAGKGSFYRVIAMEANYPSINAALRDIELMKRRGDLAAGWPLFLGDAR
jgi:hypothetical protein